jgi:cytochrome c-type biogenesis protein
MTPALTHTSWVLAFVGGVVSFLSPCVLPLIPGYLSYVSGVSMAELQAGGHAGYRRVLGQSVLFVLGFALVFTALGASASALGGLLADYRPVLNQISGVFIIAMGLSLLGVVRVGALLRDHHLALAARPRGVLGSTLLGAAFAFAWVPCVGPILASILAYAASTGTVRTGALLLLVYALGLGTPFIAAGLAFARTIGVMRRLRQFSRPLEAVSGVALTTVGILMLTNKMFYVSIWGQQLFTRLGLNLWQSF